MDKSVLDDMEILKKIINNEIQLDKVDIETKKRLIVLCNNREKQIREKIKMYKQ